MPVPALAVPVAGPIDSELAFATLHGGAPWAFWLDGGLGAVSGRSLLGAAAPGGVVEVPAGGDVRDVLATIAAEASATDSDALGWYGWVAFEAGLPLLGLDPDPSAAAPPAAVLLRADLVVEIEHSSGSARVVGRPGAPGIEERMATVAAVLRSLAGRPPLPAPSPPAPTRAHWRHSADDYAAMVRACQAGIRAGDAYQLCLTNEVRVAGSFDPLERYRALRRLSPSHHGGLLRAGARSLLSSSPERFLELRGDRVETSPIKGTRPRGATPEEDARLRAELSASAKERAENVMIVDLMRNDLSRVGRPGTVVVDALLAIETYPQVHQLVSTVSARLEDGVSVAELLAATFPAGSMTGAPKRRAVQLLRELEGGPRGVYAGAFGRFGDDGSLDLAMTIRSIVLDDSGARIGTGGGITALSVPEEEVEETRVKARALLAVLGAG